ncbi:hypothetical protein PCCS19_05990 [Paenibacillus sp. CCS19]|uniref:histidine kinase n=1 Tax=Paenibacillus sp. CCS19 TaxID=3158387 RepID=UPI00256526C5|nr:histidine kinase [Paenibacillus cellulosilyticus]GMK37545.1 hypothetical protein PCCS19_05990 [Paenibacillus cellulosilyticus]
MSQLEYFFEHLKQIKDEWVEAATKRLDPTFDLILTEHEDAIKTLQQTIQTVDAIEAFRKNQDEIIEGVIHSILVMFDHGSALVDKMKLDIVDLDTRIPLNENEIALHEEFITYMNDHKD